MFLSIVLSDISSHRLTEGLKTKQVVIKQAESCERLYQSVFFWVESLGTVVDTLCRIRAGRLGVRVPVRARDFSLLQNLQTCFGAQPAYNSMGTGVLSRW